MQGENTGRLVADRPVRLGLIGLGKIAHDQHLPAIWGNSHFMLASTASHNGARSAGVPGYDDVASMLAGGHELDAVSICTPPKWRHAIALAAIESGMHVMLEKPPAATLSEAQHLVRAAAERNVSLFTTWHSREAAGIATAREWLASRHIQAVRVIWHEDIRRWHFGQEWILGAGGFGVFDPGINALSILTKILPDTMHLEKAILKTPQGRASPIAAALTLRSGQTPVTIDLDFRQTGIQTWTIEADTDGGTLALLDGGRVLQLPGGEKILGDDQEYAKLYSRFSELVRTGVSSVDLTPLQLVADAYLIAERITEAGFEF
jgi:D-galactose 1-dehydrogenase